MATLGAALVADGRALATLGERERAGRTLRRAARLADEHGLVHVRQDARAALADLG